MPQPVQAVSLQGCGRTRRIVRSAYPVGLSVDVCARGAVVHYQLVQAPQVLSGSSYEPGQPHHAVCTHAKTRCMVPAGFQHLPPHTHSDILQWLCF